MAAQSEVTSIHRLPLAKLDKRLHSEFRTLMNDPVATNPNLFVMGVRDFAQDTFDVRADTRRRHP